MSGTDVLNRT
jgi:hypothetical protein